VAEEAEAAGILRQVFGALEDLVGEGGGVMVRTWVIQSLELQILVVAVVVEESAGQVTTMGTEQPAAPALSSCAIPCASRAVRGRAWNLQGLSGFVQGVLRGRTVHLGRLCAGPALLIQALGQNRRSARLLRGSTRRMHWTQTTLSLILQGVVDQTESLPVPLQVHQYMIQRIIQHPS